jgi:large subunit ribosomal protein L30e
MNFEDEMKKVLKDGEILIGDKKVKKALLNGKAKMVIVAKNASDETKADLKRYAGLSDIKYYEYPESSKELGYKCAKPFPIVSIAIVKEGSSKILDLS